MKIGGHDSVTKHFSVLIRIMYNYCVLNPKVQEKDTMKDIDL